MPDSSLPPGDLPDSRPFRDRVGGQTAIRLSATPASEAEAAKSYDLLREERDTPVSRNEFLAQQLVSRNAEVADLKRQLAELQRENSHLTAQNLALTEALRREVPVPEVRGVPDVGAAQYAVIELHGQNVLIGRLTEAALAGEKVLRIDRLDGRPPQFVQKFYRLTMCTEEEARAAHAAEQRRFYGPIGLPNSLALALEPGRAAIGAADDGDPWSGGPRVAARPDGTPYDDEDPDNADVDPDAYPDERDTDADDERGPF